MAWAWQWRGLAAITAASFASTGATMAVGDAAAHLADSSGLAIARHALLESLYELAVAAGQRAEVTPSPLDGGVLIQDLAFVGGTR